MRIAIVTTLTIAMAAVAGAVDLARSARAASGVAPVDSAATQIRLLDVPYVPQSGVLCGGAALAMILRFWGQRDVLAEHFAEWVDPAASGIRTDALAEAAIALQWSAYPMSGDSSAARIHVAQGRPVILLIRSGGTTLHYVVVVGWIEDRVVFHDPKVGPFRSIDAEDFHDAWEASDYWGLLVLPPTEPSTPTSPAPFTSTVPAPSAATLAATSLSAALAPSISAMSRCDSLVSQGVRSAKEGDFGTAEAELNAARMLCPDSASPLRELAGLRFRADDWKGARELSERALVLDPGDTYSRRLSATSRFLAGDTEGALDAWNHLEEPVADLADIEGLLRIRYSAVSNQLDLPPGTILTAAAFRRAQRRLAELPAHTGYRLALRPLAGGSARVDVALVERPLIFGGPWGLGSIGMRAATQRELMLHVASPTGNGELWSVGWRWWRERPRVSVQLAVPALGGRPGIWRVESSWERQSYSRALLETKRLETAPPAQLDPRGRAISDPTVAPLVSITQEDRRRSALSYADWIGSDLCVAFGLGLDEWDERASFTSLEGGLETRWNHDRLALGVESAVWIPFSNEAAFETVNLFAHWFSASAIGASQLYNTATPASSANTWHAMLGFSHTTSDAPLALWSGAGTGQGRSPLLRAHPLLDDGVIAGRVFGRTLSHLTVERLQWRWTLGPLRLGWVLFADAATAWNNGHATRTMQVDSGAGLRLRSPGSSGVLRLDAAVGLEDGASAISLGWQVP